MAAIDHGAIAQQIDLKTCEIGNPIGGAAEARRMAWREPKADVVQVLSPIAILRVHTP
jgi:hypothetical protein